MAGVRPRLGIALRVLLAMVVAALLLVLAVLPAEYGYDPTGAGELLGLTGLAEQEPSAVAVQKSPLAADAVTFELLPFESLEYKYRLARGAVMVFSWEASGELVFDLHAEPDGADPGYAQSFAQGRSAGRSGSYVAAFPGIHGWFWENRGPRSVDVSLVSYGFFTGATVFRDGRELPRQIGSPGQQ